MRREGPDALHKAVDAVAEEFMWDISKEFFATVLPAAGFEDIGDLMELGLRGMFADQWYVKGEDREEGEKTIRRASSRTANWLASTTGWRWNSLPPFSLGYGICRYGEVHGAGHDDDHHAADGLALLPAGQFLGDASKMRQSASSN